MAAIVEQQSTQEESAARRLWNNKMQEHPTLAGLLAMAGEVAGFFLNGHFIVALARWVIRVSGYVAESALLFAVLWISGTSVAPNLIELFMSEKTMQYLVSVALIALALIPEVILANALVTALGRWQSVLRDRRNRQAWVWAFLLTFPAILFLALTSLTLGSLTANGGNYVQASNDLLGWRCFAGWTYGLLELVYAGIGRKMVKGAQPMITPAHPAPVQQPLDYEEIAHQLLPLVAQEVRQIVPDTSGMVEQIQQLRAIVEDLARQIAQQSETVDETETNIASFEDETEDETEGVPSPCITRKLKQERSETKREATSETRRETNSSRGAARQKALRAIKRTPDINATELAKRVGITPQYAGQILKQQSL